MLLSRIRTLLVAPLLLTQLSLNTASAADYVFYRYKDANGSTVMGSSVPPEFARKGYEVVDGSGRVIKVIPPALTPEQIAERNKKKAEEERKKELALQQAKEDKALLRLYSHPDDARRARSRKEQEIKALISIKEGSITTADKKLQNLSGRAANLEKLGRKISEDLLTSMKKLEEQKEKYFDEIQKHKEDLKTIDSEFASKIERLEQLMVMRRGSAASSSN